MERIAKLFRKRFGGMVILAPKVHRKNELAAALAEIGPVRLGPRAQPRSARRR